MLYEALPADFIARYPTAGCDDGGSCLNLWIHWRPEEGSVDFDLPGFPGLGGVGHGQLDHIAS